MADDESVGRKEVIPALCEKVVKVFTDTLCWESPALLTRVMVERKLINPVSVTKKVRENDIDVGKPDAEPEALVHHVLEMIVVLKSDAMKRKLVSVEAGDMGVVAKRPALASGVSALELSCIKAAGTGNSNLLMETPMEFANGARAKLDVVQILKDADMKSENGLGANDIPWYSIPDKAVFVLLSAGKQLADVQCWKCGQIGAVAG